MLARLINQFQAIVPFLYSMKASENYRNFSMFPGSAEGEQWSEMGLTNELVTPKIHRTFKSSQDYSYSE